MFPSEAYLALCKQYKEMLREEWKKRGWGPDDWFYNPTHEEVHLLAHSRTHDIWFRDAPKRFARFLEHNIPLPSRRQLIEMLEERGYRPPLIPIEKGHRKGEWCVPLPGNTFERWEAGKELNVFGPDPETALLRALVSLGRDGVPEVVRGG